MYGNVRTLQYASFGLLVISVLGFKPCLYASSPVWSGFLRFTSGVTPADILTASLAA